MATSSFKKFVRHRLVDLDMTAEQASKKMGLSANAISLYIHGRTTPRRENFMKLAEVLQVDPETLFAAYLKGDDDAPGH
jgi:transcriptional regulator with XRE-family HTH domain